MCRLFGGSIWTKMNILFKKYHLVSFQKVKKAKISDVLATSLTVTTVGFYCSGDKNKNMYIYIYVYI